MGDLFEVEKIVGVKTQDGKKLYRVRWAGFTEHDDTWEPYENLNCACRMMIKEDLRTTSLANERKDQGHPPDSNNNIANALCAEPKLEVSDSEESIELMLTRKKRPRRTRKASETSDSASLSAEKKYGLRQRRKRTVKAATKKKQMKKGKFTAAHKDVIPKDDGNTSSSNRDLAIVEASSSTSDLLTSSEPSPEKTELCHSVTSFVVERPILTRSCKSDLAEVNSTKKPEETLDRQEAEVDTVTTNDFITSWLKLGDIYKADSIAIKKPESAEGESSAESTEVIAPTSPGELPAQQKMERIDENPPLAEYSDSDLPIKKLVGLTVEELDMAIFMSKESVIIPELSTFQDLRSAVLQGNLPAVRQFVRTPSDKRDRYLNNKFQGKTLVVEICEMLCDDAHMLDDVLRELVYGGARLDIVDDAHGRIPLHFAIMHGLWCRVRTLLMLRSPVNIKDKNGMTPLELTLCSRTSSFNIKRTLFLLLEHGADVNEVIQKQSKNKYVDHLMEYQRKIKNLFESTAAKIITNISVRSTITPIVIRGVWEFEGNGHVMEYSFENKVDISTYKRCFYGLFFAIFDYHGPHNWRIRMWGENPFAEIICNGQLTQPLDPDANGFLYAVDIISGTNQIKVRLKPDSTVSKLLLLTQVVVMELPKPVAVVTHAAKTNLK